MLVKNKVRYDMNYKYTALDVANYIVWYVNTNQLGVVTPLKLQKILYYITTTYLQNHDKLLFEENFEKWQYGPVVTEVYHTFKSYGFSPISAPKPKFVKTSSNTLSIKKIEFDENQFDNDKEFKDLANNVISELIHESAFALVNKTHEESAWSKFEKEIMAGKKDLFYSKDELKVAQKII
ncbi:hypothetical protein BUM88_18395 [Acinetobacter calcoaceticus]|nr:hypothetical protein BUM88_18395 [Acinetobacter calcoaceticus]